MVFVERPLGYHSSVIEILTSSRKPDERQCQADSLTGADSLTAGSLSPTFVPARLVGLAVKHPSDFALFEWFPSILRVPLGASVTLSEATAPVKPPT